jgi:hypothetical protein
MDKHFIHELILWILIIGIVIFQIIVLSETIQKVKSYIIVLSQKERYKTHKVYIPVEEIDSIDSQLIIDNLSHYTKKPLSIKVDKLN